MGRWVPLLAAALALAGCTKNVGCLAGDDGSCIPPSPCQKLAYSCADSTLSVQTLLNASLRPAGSNAQAARSDILMSNGRVSVVIDALSSPRHIGPSGGTIIDFITHEGTSEDVLNQVLQVAGILPHDAVRYLAIEIYDRSPEFVAVVVRGELDGRPDTEVVTRYELRRCEPGVRIRTELYHGGHDPFSFFLADGFWWGNHDATPFVPLTGQGFTHPELSLLEIGDAFRTMPFMAASNHTQPGGAYAVVPCARKTVDGFQSSTVSAVGLPRTLFLRGDSAAYERFLVAGAGIGLDDAVDHAMEARAKLHGEAYQIVRGRAVTGANPVGGDERQVSLLFYELGGGSHEPTARRPWNETVPDSDGTFEVWLPQGREYGVEPRVMGRPEPGAAVTFSVADASVDLGDVTVPGTATVSVTVTDGTNPVLAEIVLTPLAPTTVAEVRGSEYGFFDEGHCAPYLGPANGGSPACNRVLLDTNGTATFQAPAGAYWVYATHGPFWNLQRQQVSLVAGQTENLSFTLTPLTGIRPAGVLSADFHVHSANSFDTGFPPSDRVRSFLASDVEVIAATEHDVVGTFADEIAALGVGGRVVVMPGVETTGAILFLRPPDSEFPKVVGHYNFWPLVYDRDLPRNGAPWDELAEPGEIFDRVAPVFDGTGVIQLNHPLADLVFGRDNGYLTAIGFDPREPVPPNDNGTGMGQLRRQPREGGHTNLDHHAQEVMNGTGVKAWYRYRAAWFSFLNQGLLRAGTANSDSHTMSGDVLGYPRNLILGNHDLGAFDPEAFNADVRAGRMLGTNGPVLLATINDDGGQARGPSLAPFAPDVNAGLALDVRAAPWIPVTEIRVFVNGALVHTISSGDLTHPSDPFGTAGTIRYQGTVPLASILTDVAIGQDAWIVVEAGTAPLQTADLDDDGLPDTTDNNGDGVINSADLEGLDDGFVEPTRPDEGDARFHAHVVAPGLWPGAFTNPLLLDLDGNGWQAPGLP